MALQPEFRRPTGGFGSSDGVGASPGAILEQESARTFMAGVYRWMVAGLALTGVAMLAVASNREWTLLAMQWRWGLVIGQLGLVIALSAMAQRLSGAAAGAMFLAYAALTGISFSGLLYAFGPAVVGPAFFVSAGAFGALSVYATVTKKDLSGWGTFLFMGLIGVVIASIVNIFVASSALSFVLSCAGVVVFGGLTAYDTQKLRQMHASAGNGRGGLAINGALTLYLDFINLFLSLLRLMGNRR
jgi:uncharacterized protein